MVSVSPADAGLLPLIRAIASCAAASRLELDVLEDRHALLAGDDVLQALDAGVLPGDDDVAGQAVALEHADDRVGDVVVGGEHAVDLAAGAVSAWVNVGAALLMVQPLTTDSDRIFSLPWDCSGSSTALAPFANSTALLSTSLPPSISMICGLVTPSRVEAVDEGLPLQLADVLVVERDVVRRGAAEVDAVVVDDLDAGLLGLLLDRRARGGVDRVDDQDLDARTDHALRDRSYLEVLPPAFWMSGVRPAELSAFCRSGLS